MPGAVVVVETDMAPVEAPTLNCEPGLEPRISSLRDEFLSPGAAFCPADFAEPEARFGDHLTIVIMSVFDLATSLLLGSVAGTDRRRDVVMANWPGWPRS